LKEKQIKKSLEQKRSNTLVPEASKRLARILNIFEIEI